MTVSRIDARNSRRSVGPCADGRDDVRPCSPSRDDHRHDDARARHPPRDEFERVECLELLPVDREEAPEQVRRDAELDAAPHARARSSPVSSSRSSRPRSSCPYGTHAPGRSGCQFRARHERTAAVAAGRPDDSTVWRWRFGCSTIRRRPRGCGWQDGSATPSGAGVTASLAVSGGSSSPPMLAAFVASDVPWDRLTVWQVDERIAPDGDPARNAGQLADLPCRVRPDAGHERRPPCGRSTVRGVLARAVRRGPPGSRGRRPHRLVAAGRRGRGQHPAVRGDGRVQRPATDDDHAAGRERGALAAGARLRPIEGADGRPLVVARSVAADRPGPPVGYLGRSSTRPPRPNCRPTRPPCRRSRFAADGCRRPDCTTRRNSPSPATSASCSPPTRQRADRYVVEAAELRIDYSKHRIDDAVLAGLIDIAAQRGVEARRDAMFAGEHINTTEDRAVMHVALRAPRGASMMVDGVDVVPDVHAVLDQMAAFADRIRADERITHIVNIGIGGSDLGPAMAYRALEAYRLPRLRCSFVSNVDGADIASVLADSDPASTLFIVASKTFGTIETLTNARTARDWLVAELGEARGRRSLRGGVDERREGRRVRHRRGEHVRLLGLGRRSLFGRLGDRIVVDALDRTRPVPGVPRRLPSAGRALPHRAARRERAGDPGDARASGTPTGSAWTPRRCCRTPRSSAGSPRICSSSTWSPTANRCVSTVRR